MAFIDYYKVLQIDKKATETEIKKAYRKWQENTILTLTQMISKPKLNSKNRTKC
jgi:preprotein translocase subunit Sec63